MSSQVLLVQCVLLLIGLKAVVTEPVDLSRACLHGKHSQVRCAGMCEQWTLDGRASGPEAVHGMHAGTHVSTVLSYPSRSPSAHFLMSEVCLDAKVDMCRVQVPVCLPEDDAMLRSRSSEAHVIDTFAHHP